MKYVTIVLGGLASAMAVAIPLVDDGLLASESLSIALAGLVGTGLVAYPSPWRADRPDTGE